MILDDAAEVNLISQASVLKHRLASMRNASVPHTVGFNRQSVHCFGVYRIAIRLKDSLGVTRDTIGVFYAVAMLPPELILGRP
jgi:hypothetical protein